MNPIERTLVAEDVMAGMLAASPDCMNVLSADGTILFMNERGVEVNQFGSVDDVLGKNFTEMWPEQERDKVRAAIQGAAAGRVTRMEGFCPTAKGEPRWWEARFAPMEDAKGGPTRVVGISRDISDRRQAQDALLQTRERLELTLSKVQFIGIWEWHIKEDRVFADERFAKLFSVDPDRAATGAPIATFLGGIHPDDRARVGTAIQAALGSGDVFISEYRVTTADGIRHLLARGQTIMDADGKPERFPGVIVDITDQKAEQIASRETEARYRSLFNSIDAGFCIIEMKFDASSRPVDYRFIEINPSFEVQTGLKDAAGKWMRELAPGHEQHWFDLYGKVALTGESVRFENPAKQLADRWYDVQAFRTGEPDQHRVAILFNDISDRRRTEEALHRLNETLEQRIDERTAELQTNEGRLRAILETSNQYQALLDLKGNILFANATALAGIQADAADVAGMAFWESPWFAQAHGGRDYVRRAVDAVGKGENIRTEVALRLPAGERTFDFSMRPIFDPHGAVSSILAEAVDITERRQAEEALRQSQKMEAVGQLTGGVAHDFNNLLTIIRSATDFLRRRELPDERRRRYIDAISDTVDRASKLTAQLLAFARRQPLTPEVFDVGAQVETIAHLLRPLVGGRIQIELDLCHPACFAVADIAQFENALVNLAVNGRDAMAGEGTLKITLATVNAIPALRARERREGTFIAVSVMDTGSGITADKLEAIFEPFYTTKEVGKGTGLGLSQAFGFAKQSGGEIAVVSEPDRGSTFTIYLPEAGARPSREQPNGIAIEKSSSGRGHCVLVVEDNDGVGQFSTELLQDLGYAIKWARNAKDALALLAQDEFAFDLVFSDVIMPGMNGVELATVIREQYPGLPVVLTSGYSSVLAENAHRGFELIQKPYSVEALSRVLRKAIAERLPVL